VKSWIWIRIRIKVKIQELSRLKMEPWRAVDPSFSVGEKNVTDATFTLNPD
jgi:hypothetical protein